MMEVSWLMIFYVPLAVNLLVVSMVGLFYFIRRYEPHVRYANERIYRCAGCGHVYVDSRKMPLLRCPRCDSLNEAVRTH